MAHDELYGTWRLVSLEFVASDDGERGDMYGPEPLGFIVFGRDDRMMTIITSRDRAVAGDDPSDAALFRGMMAYSGRFEVEGGDRFVTEVDLAWHPNWLGTRQARNFTIEAGVLSVVSDEVSHPKFPGRLGRGVLRWERVSAL